MYAYNQFSTHTINSVRISTHQYAYSTHTSNSVRIGTHTVRNKLLTNCQQFSTQGRLQARAFRMKHNTIRKKTPSCIPHSRTSNTGLYIDVHSPAHMQIRIHTSISIRTHTPLTDMHTQMHTHTHIHTHTHANTHTQKRISPTTIPKYTQIHTLTCRHRHTSYTREYCFPYHRPTLGCSAK